MRRRDFIEAITVAATWPIAARAQQPTMPVVAFLRTGSADIESRNVAAFRKGLGETGYVEDQNVTVEYHWLASPYDRLPALIADLVRRQVARDRHGRYPAGCACGESRNSNDPNRLR
jgi:putative ABC transport system substrate-binding protein